MSLKLEQTVRCAICKRSFDVDVLKSKDPFAPIGPTWQCGKVDCEFAARQAYAVRRELGFERGGPLALPSKPSKYHNQPTTVDGIKFASKKEANRYAELKLMERGGEIEGLKLQPRFDLRVKDQHICTFVADFSYVSLQIVPARTIVEDAKGVRTPVFKIKKKLMAACLGIDVVEV